MIFFFWGPQLRWTPCRPISRQCWWVRDALLSRVNHYFSSLSFSFLTCKTGRWDQLVGSWSLLWRFSDGNCCPWAWTVPSSEDNSTQGTNFGLGVRVLGSHTDRVTLLKSLSVLSLSSLEWEGSWWLDDLSGPSNRKIVTFHVPREQREAASSYPQTLFISGSNRSKVPTVRLSDCPCFAQTINLMITCWGHQVITRA